METYKTFCPLFPGFYNSLLVPNEEYVVDAINDSRAELGYEGVTFDEIASITSFRYADYYDRVSREYASAVCDELVELGLITGYRYESLHSPKEYNFETDRVNVSLTLSSDNVSKVEGVVRANKRYFSDSIRERYTSRSGFISYHSNDLNEWLDVKGEYFLTDAHKLGAILELCLMVLKKFETRSDAYCYFSEDVDTGVGVEDFDKAVNALYIDELGEFVETGGWFDYHLRKKALHLEAKNAELITDAERVAELNDQYGTSFKSFFLYNRTAYGCFTADVRSDTYAYSASLFSV